MKGIDIYGWNAEGEYCLVWLIKTKIRADDVGKEMVLLTRSCTVHDLVLDNSLFDSIVVYLLKD